MKVSLAIGAVETLRVFLWANKGIFGRQSVELYLEGRCHVGLELQVVPGFRPKVSEEYVYTYNQLGAGSGPFAYQTEAFRAEQPLRFSDRFSVVRTPVGEVVYMCEPRHIVIERHIDYT
jgi:hypothetical protein